MAKFRKEKRNLLLFTGLFSAALVHGLYDFFIMQKMNKELAIFTFITLIIAIIMSRFMISSHIKNSPHK
jgi:RsiW-degrading membrane proteinase PrsW (M82 family)